MFVSQKWDLRIGAFGKFSFCLYQTRSRPTKNYQKRIILYYIFPWWFSKQYCLICLRFPKEYKHPQWHIFYIMFSTDFSSLHFPGNARTKCDPKREAKVNRTFTFGLRMFLWLENDESISTERGIIQPFHSNRTLFEMSNMHNFSKLSVECAISCLIAIFH